jgi:predicted enzyme related to lactoylglutathione lyase
MQINDAPFHPTLATSDVARAKAWYADNLAWAPLREMPDLLVYQVGESYFTLYTSDFAGTNKATAMNYIVPDVRATVGLLRERGVEFEEYDFGDFKTVDGIMEDPGGGVTAWFKDADGNIIAILQDADVSPLGTVSGMIAAADLGRAKAWYSANLGLEPFQEFQGMVMDYKCGASRFNIYRTEFAGTAKNTVGMWRLKDVPAEVERLKARGVTFEEYDFGEWGKTVDGIMTDPNGETIAWFKDSEGNILGITEDRPM